jgi:N-acetylneuraminate synthase
LKISPPQVQDIQLVAEASSNHSKDLTRALQLVTQAANAGFDAIKFQLFRVNDLFSREILNDSFEHRSREDLELPPHFIPDLADTAHDLGIEFSCTPFSLSTVEYLAPYVDFLKVSSYELLWDDLLRECAMTGLPLVISTGMANLEEVDRAVDVVQSAGCETLTLLHCVSAYPTPASEANLAAIATLRAHTGLPIGWSDHTNDPAVIHRAVHRWGASFVELHLDVDGEGAEFYPGHCWLPETAAPLIRDLRSGINCDGTGIKEPALAERPDRQWRADPSDGLRPLLAERARWRDGRPEPI